ncbi:MAG: DUF3857 domain-containing protein, partial [Spirochaetes bacterium]|nr:DUF3857 domain-containing protein [Spirochaetota bacterium]
DIAIKGNDKDQAVKFLKQLLKTKPHDKNIKRRILYLTGTQQNLIDRFSVDVEQKIKKIFSQGLDTYKKKYRSPGITPYRGKIVKVSDDGTTETLVTVLYYIINPRGAEIFKKEKINYVPDNEELEIIKAQTITRKGARTDSKDENTYSLIDTDKNLYYNYLAREISFANVKADTIILLQYTIWSKAGSQLEKSYYGNSEIFADFYPVQEKDYTLIFPRKMNIFYKYDHFKKKPKFKKSRYAAYYIYQWRQKDLFQLNYEPNMGSPFSFVPQLHLTSFKNWNELSGWLRQLSESQKQLNSTMRSVVDKMKNDSQTKEEMIAKIYRYVRDVIRYVGLEYGLGGIRPRNAISVYSSRFGDCKDKAVLLNAMLQYAGIESYLGLVSSSQRGETMFDIPEIGLFDHAICLASHDGKDYFLDATAMYHDFNEFPYYDRMNKILLLKGDGTFITPPRPDIDQNQYQAFTTGTINTVGKFSLKRKISAIGQFAPTFRYFASDPSYHKQYVENRWNNIYPGTVILSIDNKKASKPLFEYDIEINHFTDPIPGGFKFKPVLNRSEIFEKYFTLNKRQYPLVLNFPYTIQETIDISFSHDKIMTIKIPDNVDLKSKYFSLKIEYEKKENKISFRYLLKINKIKIYPDEYTRARKMALKIKNAEEKYIRVLW